MTSKSWTTNAILPVKPFMTKFVYKPLAKRTPRRARLSRTMARWWRGCLPEARKAVLISPDSYDLKPLGLLRVTGLKPFLRRSLTRARAASAHGKRGYSQAAPAVAARQRSASPKRKAFSPPAKRITLRSRTKALPRRDSVLLTLTTAPGVQADFIHPVIPKSTRQKTSSPIAKKNAQAASAADRAASPSITPEERANLEMRAQAAAGKRSQRVAAVSPAPIAGSPLIPPAAIYATSSPPEASAGAGTERKKGAKILPLTGSVALAAAASTLPTTDAAEAVTCSVDDMNNQHCTMLYTEDYVFPWFAFACFIIVFAATVSYSTYHMLRWWQRRRAEPVTSLPPDEDAEVEELPVPPARPWQPDESGEMFSLSGPATGRRKWSAT